MNDRHPSGNPTPTVPAPDASYTQTYGAYDTQQGAQHAYAGYDGYSTGTFDALGTAYGEGDPLFGSVPGDLYGDCATGYDTGQYATGSYDTGHYDTSGQWDFGAAAQQTAAAAAYDTGGYDTGSYDTSGFGTGGYDTGAYDTTGLDGTGTGTAWDTGGYQLSADLPGPHGGSADATGQWDTSGHWDLGDAYDPDAAADTGTHDTTQWGGTGTYDANGVDSGLTQTWDATAWATGDSVYEQQLTADDDTAAPDAAADVDAVGTGDRDDEPVLVSAATGAGGPRRDGGSRRDSRTRRRTSASRPKRSALLTVAVPSVAIMGVTAVAAAAVGGIGGEDGKKDDSTTQAAPDPGSVKPSVANSKLDTQLAGLADRADDFADRANRTQERIDLKERQAAERKRKAEEAARKERLRPKFALPVAQHGLSAQYGQAGINWMSVHTGIDFPVSYGTPVMAATDGTVRTQWNSAYGNMAIVTSPDGTETWYCHLSSTKIRSGSVKAGDVIAYSGNSGNSTGPHLHFEVRPGAGSAVDPLPWLRSHGLDPM
ncbi:M23 family metallopeptidase [Streptomyces sp. XD-27]|uniref:M23 family metallopeptidase n=1 Tax=Streptomyces sp. XD-27 TaxID=3062779 RepID=UPI0026F4135E|nr:M23 family metallopeptidase [Streptomyces sp. XD-27]WKX70892.1 M23 family metallopeptidase [Streptomyces sp. XD-27]